MNKELVADLCEVFSKHGIALAIVATIVGG